MNPEEKEGLEDELKRSRRRIDLNVSTKFQTNPSTNC
jgi:hypothetical protein